MASKGLSRRDFLRMSGSVAALAAAGIQLPHAMAAALRQDPVNIVFGGWGDVPEDTGVQAAIAVFEQEMPNINVEWQLTPSAA